MRLLTYVGEHGLRVGVRRDDGVAATSYTEMRALVADGAGGLERVP